ncbi:hypothetical protein ADL27_21775, partial [Streptomyces sp. NRRL F-6602]
ADTRWHNGAHRHLLFHSPHSFDAATYEIWAALLNGHTLTVAEEDITARSVRRAVTDGVTSLFLTKALFDLLAEEDPECFAGLREVWTGGEAASPTAMARVLLHPHITNIQTSWVKLGAEGAAEMLRSGANDLGGTLMEETISRMAGSRYGSYRSIEDLRAIATLAGRPARPRTTLYGE